MSDTKCEACGARGNHIPPDGGIFEKHLAYEARLRDENARLRAEVERFTDALKAEESRILADERLYYPPAAWQVNAILAMDQVSMTSRLYLVQGLLGKKVGIPDRPALANHPDAGVK